MEKLSSMTLPKRYLTVVGDPNSIGTWSGTPYYFLRAAKAKGLLDGGLPLDPNRLRIARLAWNLWMLLTKKKVGGFQYSEYFVKRSFELVCEGIINPHEPIDVISHFPLLPDCRSLNPNSKVNFYIDATLKQNFIDYQYAPRMSQSLKDDAIRREKYNYEFATRVFCMSSWAADSVLRDYGIDPKKVIVVVPGANLSDEDIGSTEAEDTSLRLSDEKLKLCFVGRSWRRKGLPFLLDVASELKKIGINVEVVAIGLTIDDYPAHELMRFEGVIDKKTEMERFVATIKNCHFGCLFSEAEAAGISTREFLRIGRPVLARRVGGLPDSVPEECGILFDPKESAASVALSIKKLVDTPSRYAEMRKQALLRSDEFSWNTSVEKLVRNWGH